MLQPKTGQGLIKFLEDLNYKKQLANITKKYRNKKVIIYGGGLLLGAIIENYGLKGLNIIGIADKKFINCPETEDTVYGYKIIDPLKIRDYKPDIVLICAYLQDKMQFYIEEALFKETGKFKYQHMIKKNLKMKIQDAWYILGMME